MFDIVEEFWTAEDLDRAAESSEVEPRSVVADFESRFARWIGAEWAAFVPSGTDGIARLLAAHEIGRGDEVLVPSFLCVSVAHSVLASGAVPVLVDSTSPDEPTAIRSAVEAFSARSRMMVAPHLFGIPHDLSDLRGECRARDVILVEDCAHTLIPGWGRGSSRVVGDYTVFSFNYDKPLSLGGGGMVAGYRHSPLGPDRLRGSRPGPPPDAVRDELDRLSRWLEVRRRVEPRGRKGFLVRLWRRYRMRRVEPPVIGRRRSEFNPDHEVGGDAFRAALGSRLLPRYDAVRRRRNSNARHLARRLVGEGLVDAPSWLDEEDDLAVLRLPVLLPGWDAAFLDEAGRLLCSAGFRAGRLNWPRALHQIPELERRSRTPVSLSGATAIARHLLNLPVHQNLRPDDLDRLAGSLVSALETASPSPAPSTNPA